MVVVVYCDEVIFISGIVTYISHPLKQKRKPEVKLVNILCSPVRPMKKMKMQVFWEVTVCRLVNSCQHFAAA
jgi:hypothetical protein